MRNPDFGSKESIEYRFAWDRLERHFLPMNGGHCLAAQNVCASRFRDSGDLRNQFRGNAQFGKGSA